MRENAKFVEAKEIVKPGKTSWKYVGIELERNKESVSLLCVGDPDWDDIIVDEFENEKYKFKVTDKDRVHHVFTLALKDAEADLIKAETELLRAQRNLTFHKNKIKEYFGKPVLVEVEKERDVW